MPSDQSGKIVLKEQSLSDKQLLQQLGWKTLHSQLCIIHRLTFVLSVLGRNLIKILNRNLNKNLSKVLIIDLIKILVRFLLDSYKIFIRFLQDSYMILTGFLQGFY